MRVAKAAASAAIASLLLTGAAIAKPIATVAETNLRKGPGTDTEVLTLIPKGTTVEVGKCTNGWCEASLDGKAGFVIARNVGMAPRRAPRVARLGAQVVEEEFEAPPVYYRPYRPYPYFYRPYPYAYYGRAWGWGW
ncbi:MAG TPA: SH3 domain-containing protein [Bradyrhizobium sp.]|uniref:SH3 domain-containing protein n=1 Tax=Bradyrhizobium sp. TaxID=376 RepID=UPI002D8075BD|nr:SH3 domain-containing protein [Bradyrhizobium sp.]HET7888072.1 SH3 domain-containing protein [Bradyrhizobium sp.]